MPGALRLTLDHASHADRFYPEADCPGASPASGGAPAATFLRPSRSLRAKAVMFVKKKATKSPITVTTNDVQQTISGENGPIISVAFIHSLLSESCTCHVQEARRLTHVYGRIWKYCYIYILPYSASSLNRSNTTHAVGKKGRTIDRLVDRPSSLIAHLVSDTGVMPDGAGQRSDTPHHSSAAPRE